MSDNIGGRYKGLSPYSLCNMFDYLDFITLKRFKEAFSKFHKEIPDTAEISQAFSKLSEASLSRSFPSQVQWLVVWQILPTWLRRHLRLQARSTCWVVDDRVGRRVWVYAHKPPQNVEVSQSMEACQPNSKGSCFPPLL